MRCFVGCLGEGCQKSRLEKTVGVGVGREQGVWATCCASLCARELPGMLQCAPIQ